MGVLKLECRVIEQTGEIVREVFKHHVAIILFHHDLLELDNVVVVQRLEKLDLTDGSNRELAKVSFDST